jgi:hypothetical protein
LIGDSRIFLFCTHGLKNKNEQHMMVTNTRNKFENHLLSIKAEQQKRIRPHLHPTYNKRHQKIIEMIDWTWGKYKAARADTKTMNQQNEQLIIIDNIIEELDKNIDIDINKRKDLY